MSLASPIWLLLLLPVAALLVGYLVQQARRSRYAVRFATLPMLERLAPHTPGWRRHLPAALLLLDLRRALRRRRAAAGRRAGAPRARDRGRRRRRVAVDAGHRRRRPTGSPLPARPRQGFVAGSARRVQRRRRRRSPASATVLATPSPDHEAAVDALDRLELDEGTAIGDGVLTSLAADRDASRPTARGRPVPAHIVLLSDGTNTVGSSLEQAAERRHRGRRPGLDHRLRHPRRHRRRRRPAGAGAGRPGRRSTPSPSATGGDGYAAETAEQLDEVYDDIQSSIGFRTEQRDVTPFVVARRAAARPPRRRVVAALVRPAALTARGSRHAARRARDGSTTGLAGG